MGQDDLATALAHIFLCLSAGNGLGNINGYGYTPPGMHTNLFIHGIIGIFHFQSSLLDNDFAEAYKISLAATRYLPLACLNADIYRYDRALSVVHFISGVVPFILAIAGQDNVPLGNLCVAANIISLTVHSFNRNRDWGLYTAGCAIIAYFAVPATGNKMLYPLALACMEYCAFRVGYIFTY